MSILSMVLYGDIRNPFSSALKRDCANLNHRATGFFADETFVITQ